MGLLQRGLFAARNAAWQIESLWFDRIRHVRTFGDVSLRQAGIAHLEAQDSKRYMPSRAANIRRALLDVPAHDLAPYTFVDLGSGKGRALFVAAEFTFRHIVGVEASGDLHELARRNRASFRYRNHDATRIDCLHRNAMDFAFPAGPIVIYMFNPFGPATMQVVLDNLHRSLVEAPRHVVVVLLWPLCGDLVARIPNMKRIIANRRYEVFEAHAGAAGERFPILPTPPRTGFPV